MTPNSAYTLVPIQKGTDYTPTELPAGKGRMTGPIFAVLCTRSTGTGTCKISALGNPVPVEVPSQSFRQGVVYYIYLRQLVDDDGGNLSFLGYQYAQHPQFF